LYEQLREDIVSGVLADGSKLPSKRLLAEEMGVSISTVEHAYALLCDEGYVQSRERRGYFVSLHEGDVVSFPSFSLPSHSDRRGKSTTDFPFSVYAKAVRHTLSDWGGELLSRGSQKGCPELRTELSRYLARSRGIFANPEQIVIGSGAEYLYGFVVGLLGRNRIFAIEDPSYEKIEQIYRQSGVQIESLPLGSEGIASSALAQSRADVLHITPYRSYPSGVSASAWKKREYLQWAAQSEDRFLVEDDFESEFTLSKKHEDTLFSMSQKENVIYVNTFTKTIGPALRVAYMVLPERLLPRFEETLGFYSCSVPLLEQKVLAHLLSAGDFERNINRVRRRKRMEKKENL
jgi:GntR family transcriptional regulator/MocR family aminotransferase